MRGIFLLLAAVAAARTLTAGEPKAAAPPANVGWRFDGNGHFPGARPPAEWAEGKNVLWKTPVGPGGFSSPIVTKRRIFVTAEMGSLISLDLADGKVLWRKDLFGEASKDIPPDLSKKLLRGCGGDSKQSTPTPASNGDLVFYVNAMGLCACYDLRGTAKWVRVVETAEDEEHFTASPVFVGDRVVLSWGCLLALDAKDGHTLWKAPEVKSTPGTPVVTRIGDVAVAVTPSGDVVRVSDGRVLARDLFRSKNTTPLVEGSTLYVVDTTARAFELPATAEPGLRLKELWRTELGGEFLASPAYRDGLLYSAEGRTGRVCILDAKTGKLLTTAPAADPAGMAEPGVRVEGLAVAQYLYASPVATERAVFFFDDAGHAAALGTGRELKVERVNRLADGNCGTPFFIGDRIVIRGTKAVYCIGPKP